MSAYWKIPLQVIVLLLGVFVFVFYVFTRPPLLFSSVQEERLRQSEAAPAYMSLESEFDAAFEARRAAGTAVAVARASGDDARIAAAQQAFREREAAVEAVRNRATALVKETTGDQTFTDVNYIIPTFILTQLPVGLVGLLIVAILMAATDTIAGELNSLSTATIIDFYRRRFKPGGVGRALPDRVENRDRDVGPVRLRRRRLGRRARLADRGRQPVRVVLLRLDPRRVHSRRRLSARHGQRRVHRAHRGDGVGGLGGERHQRGVPLAQRDRRARGRHRRPGGERSGPDAEGPIMIFGKFAIAIVIVIFVFWLIGGLLRDPHAPMIRIFVTGGTFDKTYDEIGGGLSFARHAPPRNAPSRPIARRRVDSHADDDRQPEMTEADRELIVRNCRQCEEGRIVITHGTDTMVETAAALARGVAGKTIVLTGAMIPYAFGSSDGLFNLGARCRLRRRCRPACTSP